MRPIFLSFKVGFWAVILFISQGILAKGGENNISLHVNQVLLDRASGVTYCLESDLHHIIALDGHGHIVWRKEPYLDAKLRSVCDGSSYISNFAFIPNNKWRNDPTLGRPQNYLSIKFSSGEIGLLKKQTGIFFLMGRL